MYSHQMIEHHIKALDLTSTGDKGNYAPGPIPVYVRGVAIVCKAAGSAAGVIKGDKQPTAGSASGRGDGDVFILTAPNPIAQGKVLHKDNMKVLLKPGEQVVVEVTTGLTGVNSADVILFLEPAWEHADNNTNMIRSA